MAMTGVCEGIGEYVLFKYVGRVFGDAQMVWFDVRVHFHLIIP
jgi:hypothetical protein